MSLDPSFARRHGVRRPDGPKGAPFAPGRDDTGDWAGEPRVTRVEVLPLRPGDRLLVHVDGAAGMSAGGAERIGQQIRARLRLDDLPFDVPVLVVSPGIRVQVARTA